MGHTANLLKLYIKSGLTAGTRWWLNLQACCRRQKKEKEKKRKMGFKKYTTAHSPMLPQTETREIYSWSFVLRLVFSFKTPGVQFDKPTAMVNEQTTPVSLPHGCCSWWGSKAVWVVQCRRGSAVHLSRALELISVQINCFSCILVTGISLCLCGLLGGRRGEACWVCVCVCVLCSYSVGCALSSAVK